MKVAVISVITDTLRMVTDMVNFTGSKMVVQIDDE